MLLGAEPVINGSGEQQRDFVHLAAKIYRKSGTWQNFHADSGIIEHDGHRYIAVALAKDPAGGQWLSKLIVSLDHLICRPPG
jgi:beta-lactamase class A